METPIEQTLSKPTRQFGLRLADYLVLTVLATVGSFFVPKFWLLFILFLLIVFLRFINSTKRRYFWSSAGLTLLNPKDLHLAQTQELPPILKH